MRVFPAQLCNIIVGDHHYFLCYSDAKAKVGPPHCVGRINLETGKVEYLEVPVATARDSGSVDQPIWGKTLASSTVNSRGIDVNGDKRRRATAGGGVTLEARPRWEEKYFSPRCSEPPM